MENKVSEKIRLILNELAILNQPEQKENNFFYRREDLNKIRSLAAELYLNSDIAIQTEEVPETPVPVIRTLEPLDTMTAYEDQPDVFDESVFEEVETASEETPEPIAEEPLIDKREEEHHPKPVIEPLFEIEEEITEVPVTSESEPVVSEPVAEEPAEISPAIQPEPLIVEIPAEEPVQTELPLDGQIDTHEPSEELKEQHDFKPPRITSEQIASQISFTRRFEYINQLFGGNTELFMEFLDEMGYSRDTAHAMEIFDRHYNEKNWQRRQESAMEFKRLLQRSC